MALELGMSRGQLNGPPNALGGSKRGLGHYSSATGPAHCGGKVAVHSKHCTGNPSPRDRYFPSSSCGGKSGHCLLEGGFQYERQSLL